MAKPKDFSPLLHLTYVLQQSADEYLLRSVGVGLSQARIMSALSAATVRPQRAVARELQQTEANVSRQLRVMKRRGLVSVAKNKKDGRLRDVKLTAKGARKYQLAARELAKQETGWLKLLSKGELKSFDRVSSSLLLALNLKSNRLGLK